MRLLIQSLLFNWFTVTSLFEKSLGNKCSNCTCGVRNTRNAWCKICGKTFPFNALKGTKSGYIGLDLVPFNESTFCDKLAYLYPLVLVESHIQNMRPYTYRSNSNQLNHGCSLLPHWNLLLLHESFVGFCAQIKDAKLFIKCHIVTVKSIGNGPFPCMRPMRRLFRMCGHLYCWCGLS